MSKDEVAVRVENVSKIYQLRGTPEDKLFFLIKSVLARLWPGFKKTNAKHSHGHREFYALNNVSFEIKKGESWGFVGVNGSGKSTLLKIISGNLRLSTGRVEVDGKVAILDYGSGFNGDFTGRENVFIKGTILGLTKKQIQERLDSIIEFAEIGDFINQPVKTYSSGMVSRLGFAIMAHVDADIIITDEALAVGDVFFVQKCMKFIRSFLKKGTFLFVSHSTNDVLSLCQNAMWLEHGVIKAIGPAPSVTQNYLDQQHLDYVKNLSKGESELQQKSNVIEIIKSEIALEQSALSKLMDYKISEYLIDGQLNHTNNVNLFNDIEILPCELEDNIGTGEASITKVTLCDKAGTALLSTRGGEIVTLNIKILAKCELQSPMIGFQALDSFGQVLFADNSYLVTKNQRVAIKAGTTFVAEFTYQMPLLPTGEYTIRVAIAVGEEEGNAVLLQTINKALVFRSVNAYTMQGLVGIPMQSTEIRSNPLNQAALTKWHSSATVG